MSYEIFLKYYDSALGDRGATIDLLLGKINSYVPTTRSLLDIGCETAKPTKIIGSSKETVGLDISKDMLAIA